MWRFICRIWAGLAGDSSNRHLSFTRNRIRHELLPLLEGWNPRLREHLAQMLRWLGMRAWCKVRWPAGAAAAPPRTSVLGEVVLPAKVGCRRNPAGYAGPGGAAEAVAVCCGAVGAAPDFASTEG